MKIIDIFNKWLKRIGIDKLTHYFFACSVVAVVMMCAAALSDYPLVYGVIACLCVCAAAYTKENVLDSTCDKLDLAFSIAGAVTPLVIYLPILLVK